MPTERQKAKADRKTKEALKDKNPLAVKKVLANPRKAIKFFNSLCHKCKMKAMSNPNQDHFEYLCDGCKKKGEEIWG